MDPLELIAAAGDHAIFPEKSAKNTIAAGPVSKVASSDDATNSDASLLVLPRLRRCPDCGSESDGVYCPSCGEELQPYLPPVRHYMKELLDDVIALDSKLVRTVPALLFRPGFLTNEYLAGRRKKYLLPSRLYLLMAFIAFLALSTYTKNEVNKSMHDKSSTVHFSFGTAKDLDAKEAIQHYMSLAFEVSPYVILLFSTPCFALILKVLYRKQRRLYVEHIIFSFHFLAAALLVLVAGVIIEPEYGIVGGIILFDIYLYFALKRVYADHGRGLAGRLLATTISYFVLAGIAIGISAIAAFGLGTMTGELPNVFPGKPALPAFQDSIAKIP